MKDLVVQIDAPPMESMLIELLYEEVPDVSELAKFVRRADKLSLIDIAEVPFESHYISIRLSRELLEGRISPKTLRLSLAYSVERLYLSNMSLPVSHKP